MSAMPAPDKWYMPAFRISRSMGRIQPLFRQGFIWSLMLNFHPSRATGKLAAVMEFSPEELTDDEIDSPEFIPALKHARNFALSAHPGLHYDCGTGCQIKRASGLPHILTVESNNDFNEVRVYDTHYDFDGSSSTKKVGVFVNEVTLKHGGIYRYSLESEKHVSGLKHQANTLMEQCKVLTDQIVEAKIELDKRFARLDELDTLLSYDYPTMALDDVRPEPVVYFIREAVHTGLVKVGKTNNLHNRLPGLGETKGPVRFDYQIVHVIYTRHNDALERQLHRRFADKRRHGEWFALTPEDIAAIQGDYGTRWERT